MSLPTLLSRYTDGSMSDEDHASAYDEILLLLDEGGPNGGQSVGSMSMSMSMSMSNADESDAAAAQSTGEQAPGKVSIQTLIASMQPQLSSEDDKVRHRATLLLAEIFEEKTDMVMKPAVLHLFVVFFCNRLRDYPSLTPALSALIALLTHHGDVIANASKFDD